MGQIRQVKLEEADLCSQLGQFSFQYERSEEEQERDRKKFKPEQVWGYFEEEQLASMLTVLPLKTYIQGKPFAMGGIAGVATWPEYRRKGMVAQLLKHALEVMRERGESISFLAPFSFSFYRRYGWELFVQIVKYSLTKEQLPKPQSVPGQIKRVKVVDPLIREVYDQYARRYNGMLQRSTDWWEERLLPNRKGYAAVYLDQKGAAKGYLLYNTKNYHLQVSELIFLDQEARVGLWNFLTQHDSMLTKLTFSAPADDPFPYLVDDPRIGQEIVPYFMARIVDVSSFLSQYPVPPIFSGTRLFLHIRDEHASWNEGTFQLDYVEEGQLAVRHYPLSPKEGSSCAHPPKRGLSCSIQTLTVMLLGYIRPTQLHQLGRLEGDKSEVALWEELIKRRSSYLTDAF